MHPHLNIAAHQQNIGEANLAWITNQNKPIHLFLLEIWFGGGRTLASKQMLWMTANDKWLAVANICEHSLQTRILQKHFATAAKTSASVYADATNAPLRCDAGWVMNIAKTYLQNKCC